MSSPSLAVDRGGTHRRSPRLERWGGRTLAALLVALGFTWLVVMVWRVVHPFHLEWLESNVFLHAVRIAEGHALYEPPLEGLISHPYPPLYYLVLAGLYQFLTPSLVVGRVVSFLATLWSASCCGVLAARRSERPRLAFGIAFAAFLALYPSTGTWLELLRVDTLALALWLQGVLFVYSSRGFGARFALAILCFVAASLTKQTCLPLAGAAWLLAPIARRPHLWFVGGVLTLWSTLDLYAWFDLATDGWSSYYTILLPMGHATEPRHALVLVQGFVDLFAIWTRAPLELSANLRATLAAETIVPTLSLTLGTFLLIVTPARRDRLSLPLLALATAAVCSWSATKQGAYLNHYLPLSALAAAGIGNAVAFCISAPPTFRHLWLTRLHLLVLLAVVGLNTQDPRRHLPTEADRRAGKAWVEWLRAVEGDVQMPALAYLPYLAGKGIHPNEMGLFEIYNDLRRRISHEETLARLSKHPSLTALLEGRTTCIVDSHLAPPTNGKEEPPRRAVGLVGELLERGLLPYDPVPGSWPYQDVRSFRCRSGDLLRPEVIYVSRRARPGSVPSPPRDE